MGVRTDLAVEFAADKTDNKRGIKLEKYEDGGIRVSTVRILTEQAACQLGKPIGKYITLESVGGANLFELEALNRMMAAELKSVVGEVNGTVLVVGIGNVTVTPDALGPRVAEGVLATRHISSELANRIGLVGLRSVSVLSPGVLGQTGMEVKEIVDGAIGKVSPSLLILVDALAAREISRLGNTVQISDTGISPGSGVGNSRSEISQSTVGVRCITVGVPTVVEASTLCYDLTGQSGRDHEPLIVTPRDIDRIINKASKVIAAAINSTLQPEIAEDVIVSVV